LKKRPLAVKFSKFCSKSLYRDTDRCVVFKFYKIWPTGNRWNRVLLTWQKKQNFAWFSSCRYGLDRARSLQKPAPTMYLEYSRFHPNRFTFGGVIAERVNTAKTCRKVNQIFGWSLASSRITSLRCRWRATQCLAPTVLYTDDNSQCDKLWRSQFTTLTVHLSWQHLRRSISRSRDMVGAHQHLNDSRDLTMPLSGIIFNRGLALITLTLPTTFEVFISIQNENGVVLGS